MKRGYKHKTGVFGTDSERYVSRMLMVMQNSQGDRRPDLISVNGRYHPKLSVEVKSGRKKKGVMVDYQLHYAVTTMEDYLEFMGEKPPERPGFFPEVNWSEAAPFLPNGSVAYHYWLVNRVDEITAGDLDRSFASIKLRWGDVYSMPHRYAFAGFAAAKANRTKRGKVVTSAELEAIVGAMKETIRWDVAQRGSDYRERKSDPQSWQDIHGNDFLALFHGDNTLATKEGQERIRIIRELYSIVEGLKRITIPGPNGTTIYVLAEQDEENLFDKQVRATVEERIPLIERITRARYRAVPLLDNLPIIRQESLFENGFNEEDEDTAAKKAAPLGLQPEQVRRLNRLAHWLNNGETEITAADAKHQNAASNGETEGDLVHESETVESIESPVGVPF